MNSDEYDKNCLYKNEVSFWIEQRLVPELSADISILNL